MRSARATAARTAASAVAVLILTAGCGEVATKASCADVTGKLGDAARALQEAGGDPRDPRKFSEASREFAKELREKAGGAYSAEVRDAMNRLAADYEALARAGSLSDPGVANSLQQQINADTEALVRACK